MHKIIKTQLLIYNCVPCMLKINTLCLSTSLMGCLGHPSHPLTHHHRLNCLFIFCFCSFENDIHFGQHSEVGVTLSASQSRRSGRKSCLVSYVAHACSPRVRISFLQLLPPTFPKHACKPDTPNCPHM